MQHHKDKIFSIYEDHTDIIVKGKRDVEFEHKGLRIINLNKSVKSCIVIAWRKLMFMQYKKSIMHCAAYLTNVHGACGQLQKPDHCHMEV